MRVPLLSLAIAGWIATVAPAFSAEPPPGASPQTPAKPVTTPSPDAGRQPDAKAERAVPADAKGADTKSTDAKDAGKTPDKGADPAAPEKKQKPVALILPLGSKDFGKVAEALKLGFIAGAEADGKEAPPYRIYAADDDASSLATLYRKAAAEEPLAVVGGITREGAAVMLRESGYLPALALNAPPEGATDLPDRFFYISLNLELEARMSARLAFDEGKRKVVVLTTPKALAKRIQDSFEKEWLRLGGEIALRITYSGDPGEAEKIRPVMDKFFDKESEKYGVDAVFLAADTQNARKVRPYLPSAIPVFATSHTFDPHAGAVENLDLESVRFQEMPWFAERDHPAVMVYARAPDDMPVEYERIYALGIDAWRLARLIVQNERARDMPPLDGVTGQLTLDQHQFVRKLTQIEMRDGRPQAYESPSQ